MVVRTAVARAFWIGAWLVAGVVAGPNAAWALPSFSGNCAECHTYARDDAFVITGADGVADPAGGVGELAFFDALPGSSALLTLDVGAGSPSYAAALVDAYGHADLPLAQGAESSWTFDASGPDHYYVGPLAIDAAQAFSLAVPVTTPTGFYAFTFTVAGYADQAWSRSESFYVRVVPEAGTLAMMATGLVAVGVVARRKRRTPRR